MVAVLAYSAGFKKVLKRSGSAPEFTYPRSVEIRDPTRTRTVVGTRPGRTRPERIRPEPEELLNTFFYFFGYFWYL